MNPPESWINPKARKAVPSGIRGLGLFSSEPIETGEIVAVKAGRVIKRGDLELLPDVLQPARLQIADDFYIAPLSLDELDAAMNAVTPKS